MINVHHENNLLEVKNMEYIKKFEIYAVNVVLQQAEILNITQEVAIKLNRIQALQYVFNIPLDIERLIKKAKLSLCQDDIIFLINLIHEYLMNYTPSKVVRHKELESVLPKLILLNESLDEPKMFIPSMSHIMFSEVDIFNVDQGLDLLISQIMESIAENKETLLYSVFEDELTKEVFEMEKLKIVVKMFKNISLDVLIQNMILSDMRKNIYNIGLMINGVNANEEEQCKWDSLNIIINMRETLKKLMFIQGEIKVKYY